MARKVQHPGQSATARSLSIPEVEAMLDGCDAATFATLSEALKSDTRKGITSLLARAERRLAAEHAEAERLEGMYGFERGIADSRGAHVWVGIDEVGRGPVAGPLAAGAVVLCADTRIAGLNDSKQVSPDVRERIAEQVKEESLAWSVVFVDNGFIDDHGMTASLKRAFSEAISRVEESLADRGLRIDLVLLDGNPLGFDPREVNVIKGDAKCASIAAASIVAKVERDRLMAEYAQDYPQYAWDANKGYGTAEHMRAIEEYGMSPLHRQSFLTAAAQLSLF